MDLRGLRNAIVVSLAIWGLVLGVIAARGDEVIPQSVEPEIVEQAAPGEVLFRRGETEIVKADSGQVTARVHVEPQWDQAGNPLVQFNEATETITAKSRYVRFVPDEITGTLPVTWDKRNTALKEFYEVPDSTVTVLSWTVDTDATVEWDAARQVMVFRGFDGVYMFETPPPVAWDADKQPVGVESTYRDGVLSYSIQPGEYRYPLTVDPTVTVTAGESTGASIIGQSSTTWSTVRTTGAGHLTSIAANDFHARAILDGSTYRVNRIFLSFDTSGLTAGTVSACSLYYRAPVGVYQYANGARLCASYHSGSPGTGWYNSFFGYNSSSAHTPTYYSNDIMYTFQTMTAGAIFNQAGMDSLGAHLGTSSIFRTAILHTVDISNNAPTGSATWFRIQESWPYLSITYTPSGGGDGGASLPASRMFRGRTPIWDRDPIPLWKR